MTTNAYKPEAYTSDDAAVVVFQEYYNCSCVAYNSSVDTGPEVVPGVCPSPSCNALIPFSVLIFLAMTGLFMSEAMNISAVFRYSCLVIYPRALCAGYGAVWPTHGCRVPI